MVSKIKLINIVNCEAFVRTNYSGGKTKEREEIECPACLKMSVRL
jgi:hypothetical protein